MPSTYSNNLRFELIGPGEQPTTWGNTANNNIGTLVEGAISGAIELTAWTSGDYTLSALKGAADQARNMTLIVPAALAGAGTIIAPAVPKVYTIINKSSYDVGIKIGSTTPVTILAESNKVVVSDGTVFKEAETLTPATDTRIGGVIVGAGLSADATGVLDVIPATTTDIGGVIVDTGLSVDGSGNLSLDVATDTTIGGVIAGAGLSVDGSGILDVVPATTSTIGGVIVNDTGLGIDGSGNLTLDAATSATPGGVIVGATLTVSGGTINLPAVATGATVAYPASLSFDNYGRVTAATAGSLAGGTVTNIQLLPSSIGTVANPTANAIITINDASATDDGYLTSADWNTFNDKFGPTSTSISIANGDFTTGSGNFTITTGNFSTTTGSFVTTTGNFTSQSGDLSLYGGAIYCTGNITTDTLSVSPNAAVYANGSGALTLTTSDRRLKENILPLTGNLDKALRLLPVSYTWKPEANRGDHVEVGFIAQDMREVVPEVVGQMLSGEQYLTLDYAHLSPILAGAIQELNAKIEAITAEVEALKGA